MTTNMTPPADPVASDSSGTARWVGLATLGFVLAAAAPALLIVAALFWGLDTDDIAFFAIGVVLGAAGAVLIRSRRTPLRILALVFALAIAALYFWMAFGLGSPASFFDFVCGVLLVAGVLLALGAGIAYVVTARRTSARTSAGMGERRAVLGVAAGVVLLAVVSGILTLAGRETLSAQEKASADVVIDMSDFEFDQDSYAVVPGATVLVKNSDPFRHTFTIDALDIDVALNPGSEKLVKMPDKPGTYVLYCEPHTEDPDDPGADDMAAVLTID